MLGEVISTAGPNHLNCYGSYNFMAKFNYSSPLSNVFKSMKQTNTYQSLLYRCFLEGGQLEHRNRLASVTDTGSAAAGLATQSPCNIGMHLKIMVLICVVCHHAIYGTLGEALKYFWEKRKVLRKHSLHGNKSSPLFYWSCSSVVVNSLNTSTWFFVCMWFCFGGVLRKY